MSRALWLSSWKDCIRKAQRDLALADRVLDGIPSMRLSWRSWLRWTLLYIGQWFSQIEKYIQAQ